MGQLRTVPSTDLHGSTKLYIVSKNYISWNYSVRVTGLNISHLSLVAWIHTNLQTFTFNFIANNVYLKLCWRTSIRGHDRESRSHGGHSGHAPRSGSTFFLRFSSYKLTNLAKFSIRTQVSQPFRELDHEIGNVLRATGACPSLSNCLNQIASNLAQVRGSFVRKSFCIQTWLPP